MFKVLVLGAFYCTGIYAGKNNEDGPVVEVKQGLLQGKYLKTENGNKFSAFMGIPYAKPPIGNLRFKPPIPADAWNGILNGTNIHIVCPQHDIVHGSISFTGNEDCLYLNVYTPKLSNNETKPLYPVMIFFHGGGWRSGGGAYVKYGPEFLLDKNIVLVIPNYRLGVLGFLSTGDEVLPGNNGLKDQNFAIKWVRENVKNFGGNPDQITLFGESAGGATVHYHIVSPLSKKLFKYAISQSGSIQNAWALAPNDQAIRHGKKLAKLLDCPTDSSVKMVECLRQISPEDIVRNDEEFKKWDSDPIVPFKPVVEPKHKGAFLDEHPIDLLKTGKVHGVPWIVGVNTEEGVIRAVEIFSNKTLVDDLNNRFNEVMPISLLYDETAKNKENVSEKIRKFYFRDEKIDENQKSLLGDLYSDAWFLGGIDESVRLYKKYTKAPIYYYVFAYRGSFSFVQVFAQTEKHYGVSHADELFYLFPLAKNLLPKKTPNATDIKVKNILTKLWTDFATTGEPTPKIDDIIQEKWTPIETDNLEYYFIDAEKQVMKKDFNAERRDFWRNLPFSSEKNHYKDEL